MTVSAPARRPPVATRRFGYLIAVGLNALFLYLVNVRPGWDALPILTEDTVLVLGLVNVSATLGILTNVSYVITDPAWWRATGEIVTTAVGLAVLVRLWDVFPFAFGGGGTNWGLLVRVVLVVAIVGSILGIVVQLHTLARELRR
ncbi:hypothetical protein AB0J82_22115 [Asanoa sp. NPDC049518]|uniref:hypothetical protein n=1 Tax=unclassified Asanoa TaxID=2685164 RepID=UPI00343C7E89